MGFPSKFLLLAAMLALPALPLRAQKMALPMPVSAEPAATGIKLPSYDVSSIKPSDKSARGMSIRITPDGFSCTNLNLKELIENAYGIREDLIAGGPSWANSVGFDVQAKVAGQDIATFKKLNSRQRMSLLQALLADRFHLQLHHETKTLAMYDLVIAKGGTRLKPLPPFTPPPDAAKDSEAAHRPGMMSMGPGMLQGKGISMASIANQLAYVLGYTVADKTGLTGDFDFNLKWRPDDAGPSTNSAPSSGSDDPGVSIFTAVQEQLGLKLQSTKGPVDTLVIDHAEKPSEN